jgi:hypothetical protein
LDVR